MWVLASFRNCEQEPDSASSANRRKITVMSIIETASNQSRPFFNIRQSRQAWLGIILPLLFFVHPIASAQTTPRTTIVVFADQPMPEGLWPALESALREELVSDSPGARSSLAQKDGTHIGADLQILRGDQVQPGITVDQSITVYLHGECVTTYTPRPGLSGSPAVSGVLGWVQINNGQIDPFIHIACGRIGQMLVQQGMGRNLDGRNKLVAAGISRVVLHEWIHIATQSAHHSQRGVTKAQFGVADLLAHSAKPRDRSLKSASALAKPTGFSEAHSLNGGR
jgi:hypothetical protein